ncbi:MAG: RHS repeat domain-containing protein [Solirubrobacteraceae bacterium]
MGKPAVRNDAPGPVAKKGCTDLPSTRTTYTMCDQANAIAETFGAAGAMARVKTQSYDPAGHAETSADEEEGSTRISNDVELPEVTTNIAKVRCAQNPARPKREHDGKLDTLGRPENHTDAHGITTTYTYNALGQLEPVKYGTVGGITPIQTCRYGATKEVEALREMRESGRVLLAAVPSSLAFGLPGSPG